MFAEVDKDACIGCGACPDICPEIFKLEEDELATAYNNPVPHDFEESTKEAAESCPTEAIHLEE
jgi:ferredoxin